MNKCNYVLYKNEFIRNTHHLLIKICKNVGKQRPI